MCSDQFSLLLFSDNTDTVLSEFKHNPLKNFKKLALIALGGFIEPLKNVVMKHNITQNFFNQDEAFLILKHSIESKNIEVLKYVNELIGDLNKLKKSNTFNEDSDYDDSDCESGFYLEDDFWCRNKEGSAPINTNYLRLLALNTKNSLILTYCLSKFYLPERLTNKMAYQFLYKAFLTGDPKILDQVYRLDITMKAVSTSIEDRLGNDSDF